MTFKTQQEVFWAGSFGDDYIGRNQGDDYLESNIHLLKTAFANVDAPASLIEFGANIGLNLKAAQQVFPDIKLSGIEIHQEAAQHLARLIGQENVICDSILNVQLTASFDVSFIKGVLIHMHPDVLPKVYEKLYQASRKYILICEYYNPTPVEVNYRGHSEKLFKRDFAGEMLDQYSDLKLVDYRFCYHRDVDFPQDDMTWFLLEKIK